MRLSISVAGVISLAATSVHGWGASGHHAVGYVAMQFLSQRTLSFVKSSLGPTYSFSLGPAATWADEIKSNRSYAWASNLHFVDAQDNPPTSCSVFEVRDCADNVCILGALANYTTRVVEKSLSADQRQEALKFLDHFIGDITQPLHVEALALGGNEISVTCNKTTSNLHTVWDSSLINRLLLEDYRNSVTEWADALTKRIKKGPYKHLVSSWISCSSTKATLRIEEDISGLLSTKGAIKPLVCPLVWARDSNKLDCSFVFDFKPDQDLCSSNYYKKAVPIIETQIAKAGIRLAAWLNVLFDGATHLP